MTNSSLAMILFIIVCVLNLGSSQSISIPQKKWRLEIASSYNFENQKFLEANNGSYLQSKSKLQYGIGLSRVLSFKTNSNLKLILSCGLKTVTLINSETYLKGKSLPDDLTYLGEFFYVPARMTQLREVEPYLKLNLLYIPNKRYYELYGGLGFFKVPFNGRFDYQILFNDRVSVMFNALYPYPIPLVGTLNLGLNKIIRIKNLSFFMGLEGEVAYSPHFKGTFYLRESEDSYIAKEYKKHLRHLSLKIGYMF